MSFLRIAAIAAFCVFAAPALAEEPGSAELNGIRIDQGYALSTGAMATSGAAFMQIHNDGLADDRLVAASSPAAQRVELHAHLLENGVAKMRAVEGGVPVSAGETVVFARGGLHVMFFGLTGPWQDGATVPVSLDFERAGRIDVLLPVDRNRLAEPAGHTHGQGHGG